MPRSISAFIPVVYSVGRYFVPNGKRTHSKVRFSTMVVHVDVTLFCLMKRYAASRYIFLIIMLSDGDLIYMAEIMWSILRRKNP